MCERESGGQHHAGAGAVAPILARQLPISLVWQPATSYQLPATGKDHMLKQGEPEWLASWRAAEARFSLRQSLQVPRLALASLQVITSSHGLRRVPRCRRSGRLEAGARIVPQMGIFRSSHSAEPPSHHSQHLATCQGGLGDLCFTSAHVPLAASTHVQVPTPQGQFSAATTTPVNPSREWSS